MESARASASANVFGTRSSNSGETGCTSRTSSMGSSLWSLWRPFFIAYNSPSVSIPRGCRIWIIFNLTSSHVLSTGELQSPTRRGQFHVFGQGSLVNFIRFGRKMDRTPDFAVLLVLSTAVFRYYRELKPTLWNQSSNFRTTPLEDPWVRLGRAAQGPFANDQKASEALAFLGVARTLRMGKPQIRAKGVST